MAMLVPILGNFPPQCPPYPLDRPEQLVGRHPDCAIHVLSEAVSRKHARIFINENTWRVSDLGARNSVMLNGTKVGTASLRDGDVIRIGDLFYAFSMSNPPDLARMGQWLQVARKKAKDIASAEPATAYLANENQSLPVVFDQANNGPNQKFAPGVRSSATSNFSKVSAIDFAKGHPMPAGSVAMDKLPAGAKPRPNTAPVNKKSYVNRQTTPDASQPRQLPPPAVSGQRPVIDRVAAPQTQTAKPDPKGVILPKPPWMK
jgi:hypothetical protein